MQEFYNDGLMRDGMIPDKMFAKMLGMRKGTVKEVADTAINEIIKEDMELIYGYTYELEGFINEYINQEHGEWVKLQDALAYSVREYLLDCLHSNLYTFCENYAETILTEYGFNKGAVARLPLLRFADFQMEDTRLDIICTNVERFAITGAVS